MKKFKRIFAITLASCTLFATGCMKNDNNSNKANGKAYSVNHVGLYEGGLHELNYTKTSDYFVKNNKSDYSILITAEASKENVYAAEELQELVLEATKCKLPIVSDATYSQDKKYISLGDTAYAAAVNVKATPELEKYGFSIQTVNKSIFINSNTDIGVTFGVYGFLELQFNFDCFTDECYTIDKQDDAPLLDFEVRDVPDLGAIEQSNMMYQVGDGLRRQRMITRGELREGSITSSTHSTLVYLPLDKYGETHPKWFANNEKQLCYSARGDAEELEAMIQTTSDIFIDCYKKSTQNEPIIAFGQMDISVWCTCDTCSASKIKYGSDCAVQIQFVNEVAKRVQAWMETEEGKPYARDFDILYFAYHKSVEPPVKYDEATGKYVPVDETVIPADHTLPFLAPIEMDPHCDIDSQCNATWMTRLDKWKALVGDTGELAVWTYYRDYSYSWLPFDSFTSMQNWYRYIATLNVGMHYEESSKSFMGDFTNWYALRSYLSPKLSWNVNYDIDELTLKFFKHYYADAADEMYDVFISTRAISNENREKICDNRSIYKDLDVAEYWPEALAVDSLAKIEKGLADIAYLKKVDPAKYKIIRDNITAERFMYGYILVEYYGGQYDPDYILALKMQTKQDAEDNNIVDLGSVEVPEIWERWGI